MLFLSPALRSAAVPNSTLEVLTDSAGEMLTTWTG
jgi:hypothetical protein